LVRLANNNVGGHDS